MAHLGDLGKARPAREDVFSYFGNVIRVNPHVNELDFVDFIEQVSDVDVDDLVKALPAIKGYLRTLVHPDDFAVFWQAARDNNQQLIDLMDVGKSIVEATSGRPTGQPSASRRGRRSTGTKSRDALSSRVIGRLTDRPDLQLAVLNAQRLKEEFAAVPDSA